MSLFNWFSRKPDHAKLPRSSDRAGLRDSRGRPLATRDKAAPPSRPAQKLASDPVNRSETRKAKRHARREQLYIAVREAMTRAGVLAASYKFKVLSLDQRGDQFLVMMDVDASQGRQAEKLAEIETIIVQTAKTRFEILVTAVYWRMEAKTAVGIKPVAQGMDQAAPADKGPPVNPPAKKPGTPRYEPILDDEVAAFKQALASASATSPATVDAPGATGKSRSGLHSYTLLTGFEDTELPESSAVPVLSTSQYGDLN